MSESNKNKWRLADLKVEKKLGEDSKYTGSIRFINGDYESFRFNLDEDRSKEYLALVSEEVIRSAEELGKRIAESLKIDGE